jgi:hypothetical protein
MGNFQVNQKIKHTAWARPDETFNKKPLPLEPLTVSISLFLPPKRSI